MQFVIPVNLPTPVCLLEYMHKRTTTIKLHHQVSHACHYHSSLFLSHLSTSLLRTWSLLIIKYHMQFVIPVNLPTPVCLLEYYEQTYHDKKATSSSIPCMSLSFSSFLSHLSTCLLRTWSFLIIKYHMSLVIPVSYPVCLLEYTKNKRQGYYIIKYPMSLYTHYYPVFLITPAYLSAENACTTTRQRKNQASYVTVISVNFLTTPVT
jgi:hypothetical protein